MAFFDNFISQQPLLFLFVVSVVVNLIIVLFTKFFSDQNEMKHLKEEMKSLQTQMRNTKNTQEISKLNKKLLKLNSEYMRHSMKINLYTFLPIILIFGWLTNIYSGLPFEPGTSIDLELTLKNANSNISLEVPSELEVINKTNRSSHIIYTLRSTEEGTYNLKILPCNSTLTLISSSSLINKTKSRVALNDGCVKSTLIRYRPLKFNLLGIRMGWIWVYLIFSLFLSSIFRKILKVY